MINPLQPAIYRLKYDSKTGYYLEYYKPTFVVLGKNYGSIDRHVNTFWTRYTESTTSLGVMLTGSPGSGKTRVAELLANHAVDANMCVVMVMDITPTLELVPFLDSLHNMLIMFDEFSKTFDLDIQNKMLTMFSSIGGNRKLFVLTENDRKTISMFIRTRPGRIRYAVDYDRVEESVILEYCRDYCVSNDFITDIMEIYQKASKFTFDHLQAIVSEHLATSHATLEDLLEILNLDDLVPEPAWAPTKVIKLRDPDTAWKVTSSFRSLDKQGIQSKYMRCWLDVCEVPVPTVDTKTDGTFKSVENASINVSGRELNRIEGNDTYIFVADGFELHFTRED